VADHDPVAARAALQALQAAAQRAAVARDLGRGAETALLQSVVDAAATLFDAEASSIALFERDPDRLEFRVAAGAQGAGVIGLSVPPSRGIVGYVFSTAQPIALSDVLADPRFDRGTAERTGYVPRSIAAVPLIDQGATVGVLQVLDKRSTPTFTLRDMDLMAVFARQAAAAIEATRVGRDTERLVRAALAAVGGGQFDEAGIDALMSQLTGALDRDEEAPFWRLADLLARLRVSGDADLALVVDILEVVARHRRPGRAGRPGRPGWRGRVARDEG
jgi:GAF domain-containing protein